MKGKLYGIGAGPGDPELITMKAIKTIERCQVLAFPYADGKKSTVFSIVAPYISDQEIINCRFDMHPEEEKRLAAREKVRDDIAIHLDRGHDVAFITLGDPSTYSTFSYINALLQARGYESHVIPGITSYQAAAAALNISLCDGDKPLTILPAENVDSDSLQTAGTSVYMKAGKKLSQTLRGIEVKHPGSRVYLASRVSMPGEKLYHSAESIEERSTDDYFTLLIVKS